MEFSNIHGRNNYLEHTLNLRWCSQGKNRLPVYRPAS